MNISLFVPVYNEENIVEKNVDEIYSYLKKYFDNFELVIVDDSSNDKTSLILDRLVKKRKKLIHTRYENGPSRRENLSVAMKKAKYPLVGYMDLDLAVPLSRFKDLEREIQNGSDVAIGSRRVKGADIKRSKYRLILSTLYHKTIKYLFNSSINDYQCGFKIFKKEALFKSIDKVGYDYKFQRGWFWDAEIILTCESMGYKVKEIPVVWREGKKSSFNIIRELKVLPYLIKLRMKIGKKR